jgi:hypothetical protein
MYFTPHQLVLFWAQWLTADINDSELTASSYMCGLHLCFFSRICSTLFIIYLPLLFLSGILQMNYEDLCHIATVCTEQIGQKCKRFFSPSNFMKFEKDDSGRIAILPFYLYVMRTVSCFLQEKLLKLAVDVTNYAVGVLNGNLVHLNLIDAVVQM